MGLTHSALADSPTSPAQRLLDKLAVAKTEQEANFLYQDIIAAWLDSGGPTVDILMQRGVDAHGHEDLDLARDMFDRIILIEPDLAEAWYRRGTVFYAQGKFDEAILDFEQTLKLEPRHFEAWLGLAAIFEGVEHREAALNAYRQVLIYHPYSRFAKQGVTRLEPLIEGRAL
ncbi:tetratricopeptide repeat protein [Hirschia litorea]|uniref:Tetratricopeptide repeat protein n=1 Tax=Hirschia litorea TaxID=1199156 RepID=A0ABW2INY6_9PROT